MKKIVMALIMMLSIVTFPICAQEEEWIEIYDYFDLYMIKNNLDGNYRLMNDLVKSSTYIELIGREMESDTYHSFTGVFDGNGHTIQLNITVDYEYVDRNTKELVGLFCINEGTIKNLTARIFITGKASHELYYGGICGKNLGVIENCRVNADDFAILQEGARYIGGIAGYNSGTIKECYNTGQIRGSTSYNYNDKGPYYIGGIVGYNDGTIIDCYNTGLIQATYHVGFMTSNYESGWGTINYSAGICGYHN